VRRSARSSSSGAGGAQTYRLVPTRAITQPAFALYLRDRRAPISHAYRLIVLTLEGISAITRFGENSLLLQFGLPRTRRN
jgi:hypothetical protein